jgi:hypothetical protein
MPLINTEGTEVHSVASVRFSASAVPASCHPRRRYAIPQPAWRQPGQATPPDPTAQSSQGSTSLVITKANGDEVGHVLYDGYGAVLASTVPATLTTAMAGSGDVPDPDTGLVYLGDGRWCDPALGRPLQPDPAGGPPTVPQALNRYNATSWGPPGVAEGTGSHLHPLLVTAGKGALKTTISATAGRRLVTIAESQLPFVVTHRSAGTRLMLIMSRSARYRSFATGAASPFEEGWVAMRGWGRSFRAYSVRGLVTEIEPGLFLTERGQLVETGALPKSAAVLTAEVLRPVNITRFLAGGMFAFALSAGVQYLGDVGNPYLSGAQMRGRVAVAGIGGTVAWGIGTGTTLAVGWFGAAIGWAGAGVWAGPIGIGVGFVAGFVWFGFIQPGIFEDRGLNPKRNLAPLR